MPKADGSIIIDTEIQTDGMKEGEVEVEAAVRRMISSVKDLGEKSEIALKRQASAFSKLNQAYAEQEKKVKELAEEAERYGQTKVPTQEYIEIQNEIDKAKKKLNELTDRQIKFLNTGGNTESSTYARMQYDIDQLTNTIKYAKSDLDDLEASGGAFVLGKDTDQFKIMSDKYIEAAQKLKRMNEELNLSYDKVKVSVTDAYERVKNANERVKKSIDSAYGGISQKITSILSSPQNAFQKLSLILQELKKQILGTSDSTRKVTQNNEKLNKSLKKTERSSNGARKGLAGMLATSILFSTAFRAISAVTSGLKEGMDNLAIYSDETNQALSLLISRMTQLKNAFATAFSPAIEYAAPALAKLISLLAEAVSWTSQLLAALTGKDTFVKAVEVQQDYAESLDKTTENTDEAAKATEKALAPFDDLIQLQKSASKTDTSKDNELDPSQMFETVEVTNEFKQLADKVKETFSGLFDPIKQSWEENGPKTFESVKTLLTAAKQLASDVGSSFMQVWNIEGYGKTITDNLVTTFSNLVQTVANLVTQFDLAWTSGNTGTAIIRHLADIIVEFTNFLRQASESIMNWSAELDFSPLLKSFDNILIAIKPIVEDVGDLLLWLLDNVLLPLTKWGIEQALPSVFNLIASALKALHSVIKALQPIATWLWETFLQPLGKWTGEIIIGAIEKITECLTKFSDWASENQSLVQDITIAVIAFFAAWKFATFVAGIATMVASINTIITVLNALGINLVSIISKLALSALKFTALTAAVSAIIAVIAILAKNWNNMSPSEKVISSILAAASAAAILAVALGAVQGAAAAALVAAALAAGIAAATIAINAGKRAMSSTQSYSTSGYSYPVSAYSAVSYQMPKLATGTVVPPRSGEFAAILGDNNRETEVVSPLSTMKQAFMEALAESGFSGGRDITVQMVLNDRVFGQAVYKANNQETQRVGVRMVSQNA